MQKKSEKIILTLYLLGFLALALTIALLQPLANTPPLFGNPPDEHARYLIPQFICRYGRIPTGLEEEVRIPAYGFSYALYNVFPYIVQGYIMRFVSLFTESEIALLYTARLVNVTFGLLMAVVVYFIGKRVFQDDRFRWLFCFAVTYLPEGLFMHTYVNTDSCCMLSTAMMVYALVCVYRDGINVRNSLWMSGGIILCALSYYNAYGYIVSCILLFVMFFLQKKESGGYSYDWKKMLKYGCFIAAVVLIGIGWWFIRSYIVLDGDLLGLDTREKMAIQYAMVGNYIDFGALENVNEIKLKTQLDEAVNIHIDPNLLAVFQKDIVNANRLVYFTDNCGEIVTDKLFISTLRDINPDLYISVIVRGKPVLNDATLEDAKYIHMENVAQKVIGNGTGMPGNVIGAISQEAMEEIKNADLLISKGQGNYEGLSGCGLNIYYFFLCKCEMFMRRFGVEQFTGIMTREEVIK